MPKQSSAIKDLLGAFIGAKVQEKSGHPMTGAVVGAAAVALARRSLPLAIGLALGLAAIELAARYRTRQAAAPVLSS
jgi:hypothetical protein